MLLLALALASGSPTPYERLRSPAASASTYLKSNWNKYEENYHPTYVLDDNPKTAWTEGAEGDGAGEWLELPLSKLKSATSIKIVMLSGYQKSKNLLAANAAPKKVTVIVLGANGEETGRAAWSLERKMGPQSIEVPVKGGVSGVRLVIDEVHPGKTYKDLCISDVQIFVDSDVAYNPKAEDARRRQALAWIKERVDTAKYFAKLPKEFPWVGTQFGRKDELLGKATLAQTETKVSELLADGHVALKGLTKADRDELARAVAWKDGAKPDGAKLMRTEHTGGAVVVPDGVDLDTAESFLSLGDLVLTEAVAGSKGRARPPVYDGGPPVIVSDALVSKRSDGSVEQMRLTITETEEGRVTISTRRDWVLSYDPQGKLTSASSLSYQEEDGNQSFIDTFMLLQFARDAAGKISEVRQVSSDATYNEKARSWDYAVTATTLTAEPTT